MIWIIWAFLAIFLKTQEIDIKKISIKEGIAVEARCVESRSIKGVKFRAIYSENKAIDDYVSLPLGFPCDANFIERFNNNPVKISYYENHYLGFDIDGLIVLSLDDSIEKINDKGVVLSFTLFMAFVVSFSLFMYGRNQI